MSRGDKDTRVDQFKCPSYYDDNNVLQDCECGNCGLLTDGYRNKVTFINRAPDDKEWSAHIKLLNEWTTPDRYLRHIVQYARSGPHYPADMHVDLIGQWHEGNLTKESE